MKTFDDIFESVYKTWGASLLTHAPHFIVETIAKEYAQQEAIEFARWKDDNFMQKKGLYANRLDSTYEVHRLFTIDQLYKLYQDEKLAGNKK